MYLNLNKWQIINTINNLNGIISETVDHVSLLKKNDTTVIGIVDDKPVLAKVCRIHRHRSTGEYLILFEILANITLTYKEV